jgi:hypothetical protein
VERDTEHGMADVERQVVNHRPQRDFPSPRFEQRDLERLYVIGAGPDQRARQDDQKAGDCNLEIVKLKIRRRVSPRQSLCQVFIEIE